MKEEEKKWCDLPTQASWNLSIPSFCQMTSILSLWLFYITKKVCINALLIIINCSIFWYTQCDWCKERKRANENRRVTWGGDKNDFTSSLLNGWTENEPQATDVRRGISGTRKRANSVCDPMMTVFLVFALAKWGMYKGRWAERTKHFYILNFQHFNFYLFIFVG